MKSLSLSQAPKQYKQGYTEFYKLKIKVTPDVLIPRPETELLVDEVLKFYTLSPKPYTLLDVGTGSGNIAISIAKYLGSNLEGCNVNIIATDISSEALKVAQQNAKLHGVSDKITFIVSNLLEAFCHSGEGQNPALKDSGVVSLPRMTGDVIVTNLPYIPTARIPYLDPSVKDFEPHIALDGGEDGFTLYRKLFEQISNLKWIPHLIMGEIDYTHGELASFEATKFFPKARVEVKTDLTHKQRLLTINHSF